MDGMHGMLVMPAADLGWLRPPQCAVAPVANALLVLA